MQLSRVQQHDAAADDRKIMFQNEIVENGASRHNVLEQSSQRGQAPLAIAELVYVTPLGFGGRDVEGFVKSRIRRTHAQSRIENEQRFAHRVEDVLREVLNVRNKRPRVRGPMFRWKAEDLGHIASG